MKSHLSGSPKNREIQVCSCMKKFLLLSMWLFLTIWILQISFLRFFVHSNSGLWVSYWFKAYEVFVL